jgi:hypothetical protein
MVVFQDAYRAFYCMAVNEPLEVAEMHSRVCIVVVVDTTWGASLNRVTVSAT